jgi:hypothetical protein
MRFILGMIIGSLLTIAGVYFADSRAKAPAEVAAGAEIERPMVNWDVVSKKVDALTADAQVMWNDFTREMTGPP